MLANLDKVFLAEQMCFLKMANVWLIDAEFKKKLVTADYACFSDLLLELLGEIISMIVDVTDIVLLLEDLHCY